MDPRKAQETVESFTTFLRDRQDRITEEWVAAVQSDGRLQTSERMSREELKDHMPILFDNVTALLRAPASHQTQDQAYANARTHGRQRFGKGYRLTELLREIARIRAVLIAHTLEFEEQTPEFTGLVKRVTLQRLHGFFDELVCDSAEQFATEEQAQLREGVTKAQDERGAAQSRTEQLQKVDASRLRLLRTAAQELRNSVNAAQLTARDLLAEGGLKDEKARSQLQMLAQQITEMGEPLDDLLDYSSLSETESTSTLTSDEPADLR